MSKIDFENIIKKINSNMSFEGREGILLVILKINRMSQNQEEKVIGNITQLINEGKLIRDTQINEWIPHLIKKSERFSQKIIEIIFKNGAYLPEPKHGWAPFVFIIIPLITSRTKLFRENINRGLIPITNEWLDLFKPPQLQFYHDKKQS